jgi:hypothetical protein
MRSQETDRKKNVKKNEENGDPEITGKMTECAGRLLANLTSCYSLHLFGQQWQ